MQTSRCRRNDMCFALISWRSPLPDGAVRTERLLRFGVTADRVGGQFGQLPFVAFRTDADAACTRPISEVRLW